MTIEAVFTADGTRVTATPFASGPWDPTMQHGGAPAALVARAAEAIPTARPMRVARMTIDLLRPVPVGTLDIEAQVVREGRKIQLCSIRLLSAGTEVVRASVLKLREEPLPLPEAAKPPPMDLPQPGEGVAGMRGDLPAHGFASGLMCSPARGAWGAPGPAALWFRFVRQIVAGEEATPLMRAALTSDFCNGVSAVLDFQNWTFINGDLTISLARQPVGEWILLDADTMAGESGGALAYARLGDQQGWFGRAVQSVLLERR